MLALLKNTWIVHFLLVSMVIELLPLHSALAGTPIVRVSNVRAEVRGGKIRITYDLEGPADESYDVIVELHRRSNPGLRYYPNEEFLVGAVGEVSAPGPGKTIEWNYTRELKAVAGDDFFITVAAKIRSGTGALTWITGIILVVGGVGYLIYELIHKKVITLEDNYPIDPGRP